MVILLKVFRYMLNMDYKTVDNLSCIMVIIHTVLDDTVTKHATSWLSNKLEVVVLHETTRIVTLSGYVLVTSGVKTVICVTSSSAQGLFSIILGGGGRRHYSTFENMQRKVNVFMQIIKTKTA